MQGCQTRLKSSGWIDKGWMDTHTHTTWQIDCVALSSEVIQRRDDSVGGLTRWEWWCTMSPHAAQEERCVSHWPLRGDDQPIMIYLSLREISITLPSCEPLRYSWNKSFGLWNILLLSASVVADKNFEDEDSVDGGRSSSSSTSKAPPSGRRTVVSSVRRPSSATTAKTPGEGGREGLSPDTGTQL